MDRNEAIQQLTELEGLLNEAISLGDYIEHGAAREALDKVNALKAKTGLPGGTPAVFGSFPVFPIDGDGIDTLRAAAEKAKKILYGALGVTALALVLYFITKAGFLNTVSVLGIFASIFLYMRSKKENEAYTKRKKVYDESVEQYESTMGAYRRALANYEAEKQNGLDAMTAFAATYAEAFDTYNGYLAEYANNKAQAEEKQAETLAKIDTYDFVPSEYWGLVPSMLLLLKSGRADDYKEALNLAIREQREEEEAAARRADEERRAAIMERQAEEERRHNQQLERQQAEHNRQMERVEQQRADEERRANRQAERDRQDAERQRRREADDARRREEAANRKDWERCRSCANRTTCNRGIPNCGAYRAR